MSDGCPGCFLSQKGQQREIERVYTDAKKKAIDEGEPYAIFREGVELYGIPAAKAIEQGVLIIQFVSQYP